MSQPAAKPEPVSWIDKQKHEILSKGVDPFELTIGLITDTTMKRAHYLCGTNYQTLAQIPPLPAHPKLSLLQIDITHLEIDAIVNAANEGLLGGGGIDEAVHKAAGPLLQRECAGLPICLTGNAVITKGYKLPAKYCLHTVGPYYDDSAKPQPELLRKCYLNCLDLMKRYNLMSIAFPSISTGFYGFPHQWAADIAVKAVVDWMAHPDNAEFVSTRLNRIIFAMFNSSGVKHYRTSFEKVRPRLPTSDPRLERLTSTAR